MNREQRAAERDRISRERIAAAIAEDVANAPPLSAEQLRQLREIFAGARRR
jgi:hypothetical protein